MWAAGGVDDALDGAADHPDLDRFIVNHNKPLWCLTQPVRIEDEHALVEQRFFSSDTEPLGEPTKETAICRDTDNPDTLPVHSLATRETIEQSIDF